MTAAAFVGGVFVGAYLMLLIFAIFRSAEGGGHAGSLKPPIEWPDRPEVEADA